MKLEALQEATYADPRLDRIKSVLDTGGNPKKGYLMIFRERDGVGLIERIEFLGGGDVYVHYEDTDWPVEYEESYFIDHIEVYQTNRIV
jgi:hypothetical protein